ncbi:type II secretion system protein GspM [Kordiimonas marina]|uniref:type II secretion system protein GspM n=1 Tax=Kordiimonas marina TaxID=2872312 RepID=UPI001FF1FB91|nr:type II secretion system protein GspM [Kordiimonas marina]MCJ9430035.1 type II secretion system protein M [Kordiimonas marina]
MIGKLKSITAWLALSILVIGTVWSLVYRDLQEAGQTEETYVRKLALLARLQALPKEESAIKKQLEKLSDEAAARMLYSGDANAIQSLMQRDLRQLASRNHTAIQSMRTLARYKKPGPLQSISVQLNFGTTHEELVSFLKDIETAEPLLRVTRLSLRVQRPSTETQPAALSVMMEVTGFKANGGGHT